MYTEASGRPERIWRMNTQGESSRRSQRFHHLHAQGNFSLEEGRGAPFETGMAFDGHGIPEQAWMAFKELDDDEIHYFLHFLFQSKVFSLDEDMDNPGQHVFSIDFGALSDILQFLDSMIPETDRVKELSTTDEEGESEYDTAISSDDEDDEIILVLPEEDMKAPEPIMEAIPVCASELKNSAASAKTSMAVLCASAMLGLLLV
jgi:hypothetical protein